ncbi:hypothetical protein [Nonomuraea aridisoli]|uniref:Uncharacterized protein n=1 Tax=Nonomuraea aridisoli TaxID=2070368 RepID=A0A2W2EDP4_9ACTN|nr:hypothetical protein [Nonomuraea aridisoli]PZG20631.1 hypothetical protein C1J01_09010 [Nonomuraea aridisoli]
MIKARGIARDGQRPLALFGLSGENVTRLMAGEPISVNLADIGLPDIQIVIVGGRTEQALAEQLGRHWNIPRPPGGQDRPLPPPPTPGVPCAYGCGTSTGWRWYRRVGWQRICAAKAPAGAVARGEFVPDEAHVDRQDGSR